MIFRRLKSEKGGEPLLFAPIINLFEGDVSEAMADLIFGGGWAAFTARIVEMIRLYLEAETMILACETESFDLGGA